MKTSSEQYLTPQAKDFNAKRPATYKVAEKTVCKLLGHFEKDWGNPSTEYGAFCKCCTKVLYGDPLPAN